MKGKLLLLGLLNPLTLEFNGSVRNERAANLGNSSSLLGTCIECIRIYKKVGEYSLLSKND